MMRLVNITEGKQRDDKANKVQKQLQLYDLSVGNT